MALARQWASGNLCVLILLCRRFGGRRSRRNRHQKQSFDRRRCHAAAAAAFLGLSCCSFECLQYFGFGFCFPFWMGGEKVALD
jgi:hypothetical protein